MTRFFIATLITLALGAGSTLAKERHKREVYGFGQIFQNIAAKHVKPLLRNTARVGHWENGEGKRRGGYVRVFWHAADGTEYRCLQDPRTGKADPQTWTGPYSGYSKHLKSHAVRYPLKKAVFGGVGYQLLRYDGKTGELTSFLGEKGRWWEADVGHLQTRLPAVTWDICPDFPSAKSLGAKVNTKQTSKRYFDLLRQDPGKRILRSQYVNENAHEWLTKE